MAGRPKVGITSGRDPKRWSPDGDLWTTLRISIEDAGGEAVWLGPSLFEEGVVSLVDETLNRLDGLLLAGGADLSPAENVYADPPEAEDREAWIAENRLAVEPERDAYEVPLARRALELDMPVFGICRGFQLLNVAAGGRLIPDLRTDIRHKAFSDAVSSGHAIRSHADTLIEELYGRESFPINSRHHQGVTPDLVAPGMVTTALAPDGIVEAIEDPERSWRFAVQWHPERPEEATLYERDRRLFRKFVRECRKC
jgi:putative glutamine amidotransferase